MTSSTYGFYFAQPLWLLACVLAAPLLWFAFGQLVVLGPVRRVLAMVLRALAVILLAAAIARPVITEESRQLAVVAVIDRSESIPQSLRDASLAYLDETVTDMKPECRLAVVDVAEVAAIARLSSNSKDVHKRSTSLKGYQSRLSDGIQMAMAIVPPDAGSRLLLISDGNETSGDLKEAARIARANDIPIDVLPLSYDYDREVVFRRLAVPTQARNGQTIDLRFVLESTAPTQGRLLLTLNGRTVDIAAGSREVGAAVDLKAGTDVKTVSLPVSHGGVHEFEAVFVPDDPAHDRIARNNRAAAMTFVSGPGHILVSSTSDHAAEALLSAMKRTDIDVRYCSADEFPTSLATLLDTDAVVLIDVENSVFTYHQQEMLCRYVTELGGGLAMVGGPNSFGAGGWIGSPVADILPVDVDPPQKKQMPKGALVLIMHACEMPRGNYWGKRVAVAAVSRLSRLDMVGVLDYGWQAGSSNWVYPFGLAGDKRTVLSAIKRMQMGDMPDFGAPMKAAYQALKNCDAAQKHMIIISDGDPQMPNKQLLGQLKQAGITCTGVAVFPHSQADVQSLRQIANATGGRFYDVKDPQKLPQIFIKEAQVVRRSLIVEKPFLPQIAYSFSETVSGLPAVLPELTGYVLTGAKGGLNHVVMNTADGDPILATCQAGLGRCVAFTSSADNRWAGQWLAWPGGERFWEQVVRWVAKPAHNPDCEVFADVQGRHVTVTVEALDAEGSFVQFASMMGQSIGPGMVSRPLELSQVGPGRYRAEFEAVDAGNYIVNMRYRKVGENDTFMHSAQGTVTVPFAPEYRDLSDNAALLAQVSETTGGRILPSDAARANLFDSTGVRFPRTDYPLTQLLLLVWLGVFLLDVAVRRVTVDFVAMARRIVAFLKRTRATPTKDVALERLKLTRKKLRDQMDSQASRRYVAPPDADTQPSPREAELSTTRTDEIDKQDGSSATPPPEQTSEDETHIQRLLRARRQARPEQDDNQPGQGGS